MPGLNLTSFANATCTPCNEEPGCTCLLQFTDSFVANSSSSWDCQPRLYQQPLTVINAGYSLNLDNSLTLWFRTASDLKPLDYQLRSDLVVSVVGGVEGTDYSLSRVTTKGDLVTISVYFLRDFS